MRSNEIRHYMRTRIRTRGSLNYGSNKYPTVYDEDVDKPIQSTIFIAPGRHNSTKREVKFIMAEVTATKTAVQMAFFKNAGYSDKRRNGVGVSFGIHQGSARVNVGNAFVTDEGTHAFLRQNGSLTPAEARNLATAIVAAADAAEKLPIPEANATASAKTPRATNVQILAALNALTAQLASGKTVSADQIQSALSGGAAPATNPFANDPTRLKIYNQLIENGVDANEAAELATKSTV